MDPAQNGKPAPQIIQWILDTRPLWPIDSKASRREEVEELKTVASRALSLLSEADQASVLKYYFVKDAKMSLASHLLKHLVISKYCNVSWSQSTISRKGNGKPCFIPEGGRSTDIRIDFNVSHQAGIVSLIAAIGGDEEIQVGTDVVCANERIKQDYAHIEKEGFFDWVDIHGDVFADSELNHMKLSPSIIDIGVPGGQLSGYGRDTLSRCQWRNKVLDIKITGENGDEQVVRIQSNNVIEAKLRRFYAMWCLREAYVKMTGEALLAPWLKDLEISHVEAPAAKVGSKDELSFERGEKITKFDIFMKGKKVTNAEMELTAFGVAYMVAGAVYTPKTEPRRTLAFGKWKMLDLERDILEFAESAL